MGPPRACHAGPGAYPARSQANPAYPSNSQINYEWGLVAPGAGEFQGEGLRVCHLRLGQFAPQRHHASDGVGPDRLPAILQQGLQDLGVQRAPGPLDVRLALLVVLLLPFELAGHGDGFGSLGGGLFSNEQQTHDAAEAADLAQDLTDLSDLELALAHGC